MARFSPGDGFFLRSQYAGWNLNRTPQFQGRGSAFARHGGCFAALSGGLFRYESVEQQSDTILTNLVKKPTTLQANVIADCAETTFAKLCGEFARYGKPVDFDFREACASWGKRADTYTHRIHRYPGRLTPYVPMYFLSIPGIAVSKGRLLDPFAGCGTVLVESPVHPCHPMNAAGLEINPLARMITKVKTTPLRVVSVRQAWERVQDHYARDRSHLGLSDFPNKRIWFSLPVERRLARVLRAMHAVRNEDFRDFFCIAFSSIIRRVSLADPEISVPVRINPARFTDPHLRRQVADDLASREDADVLHLVNEAICTNLRRLNEWAGERNTDCDAKIVGNDARTFTTTASLGPQQPSTTGEIISGLDLILTSPPYVNAQRYTRSLRLELFALGMTADAKAEGELDRLQIGTERVPAKDWESLDSATQSQTADRTGSSIREKDPYRASILSKYVRDMDAVIRNSYTALKPGGHAIFVVGNNTVRGVTVANDTIVSELADAAGFVEQVRIRNRIPSRGLLTKRHHTAGIITHEHAVVLRKPLATQAGSG